VIGDTRDGNGREEEGSGQEGSGQEGSGQEGSGQEGSGQEGSGQEGSGQEGSGEKGCKWPPGPANSTGPRAQVRTKAEVTRPIVCKMKLFKKRATKGGGVAPNEFGSYIQSEVATAEQDLQNFRSRALSIITTSGGLVALVSGLLAIAIGSKEEVVSADARWTIGIALGSFVISTAFALIINLPQKASTGDANTFGALIQDHWNDSNWDQQIAQIRVAYLLSLRKINFHDAIWLAASIALQIFGIAFIAVSAFLILAHAK
jgi:hypothetical protein